MRVLIIDDEPLARERIRTLLANEADIQIVGECNDGNSALTAIHALAPDLIFLDVQMPEMDGFAVLERVAPAALPVVVFVTAFDQYALRAFDVMALDYLLKPFDRDRFSRALSRARFEFARRSTGSLAGRIQDLLGEWKQRSKYLERLVIRSGGRVSFVRINELDWLEAAGNYVRLHSGRDEYLYRMTMSQIESLLPQGKFARIHRSTIVNIDRVKELRPLFRGDYAVILRSGQELCLSRTYRDRLSIR